MEIKSWYRSIQDGIHIHRCLPLEQSGVAVHGFSGRVGGLSVPPYDTLNLGLNVDDNAEHVLENRRRFGRAMGLDAAKLVSADQPHGRYVAVVADSDVGKGAEKFSTAIQDVDVLLTNVRGPVLALHFADCVPVFVIDPVRKAVGVVHAGWKGTLLDVAGAAVQGMVDAFGSKPGDLLAAIGPAIGRCCFEVERDVAESLAVAADGDSRVLSGSPEGQVRADVKLVNWLQLKRAGLEEEKIFVSQECTCCNAKEFFSYRRENVTGRMSAWIAVA